MLPNLARSHLCRQCLAQSRHGRRSLPAPSSHLYAATRSSIWRTKRAATTQSSQHTTAPELSNLTDSQSSPIQDAPQEAKSSHKLKEPIRKHLRGWAAAQEDVPDYNSNHDLGLGWIGNALTRTLSTGTDAFDQLRATDENADDRTWAGLQDDSEVSVVGASSNNPGDLVALRQHGSRLTLLAIFLGAFGDRNHFYGSNGRWLTSSAFTPAFTVSQFVRPEELRPLLAKIPLDANPDIFDQMRKDDAGPTQADGAGLILKMTDFRLAAERIYASHLSRLEAAHSILSHPRQKKYMSLFEMAAELLPSSLRDKNGFAPTALFAVYNAINRYEELFHTLGPSADNNRRYQIFEVAPREGARVLERVVTMVRHHIQAMGDAPLSSSKRVEITAISRFAQEARPLVLASRQERPLTPYGIIRAPRPYTLQKVRWSESSRDILAFLESWTSYDLFEPTSRFHAYGALILRSLDLYRDMPLDQSTAWTFLQEIGFIPPWEIPSRYRARFPFVNIISGGGLSRVSPGDISESIREDVAAGHRKTRDDATIFCIDAPTTTVIDDGVSLERTENANESWIHIHVADPASGIKPNSDLCRYMELIPETIYLPGHFQAMLPSELGEENSKDFASKSLIEQYSLRPGGAALTFSAKVSDAGDILDYKIEPSVINKVKYLDPVDVSRFCNEPAPPPSRKDSLVVGSLPENDSTGSERTMVAAEDLDQSSKDDLLQLYKLGEAVKQKRLDKGAWPYFFPKPSVTVKFAPPTTGENVVPAEPYINVEYGSSVGASVVANTMVLAGEIAARWCSDRDIPIPYRRDIEAGKNHEEALNYAKREIYPLIQSGVDATMAQRAKLMNLTGKLELSPTPGPFFLLGLDMYAKATSPLRRFSDLIVHWQVHAALAHERQTGRVIDPTVDKVDSILPFTRDRMSKTLPFLQLRESMGRAVASGQYDWILIALIRAWKSEDKMLPSRFRFRVNSRNPVGVGGYLDFFNLRAILSVDGLGNKALKKDIKTGDEFMVEIADINVRTRHIRVNAVEYLGGGNQNA